jgi:hypothetical protein
MKQLLLSFLLLISTQLLAQNTERISIKGIVADTSGEAIPFATVMLLQPKDSSLVLFKQANDKGFFEFSQVKNNNYVVKAFFMGYLPYFQAIAPTDKNTNDLGKLKLKVLAKELMEVVVKTAKATLTIRGDTIEYNAASFKVPPGSTVEDLLRRLPGIDVDADGNLKAQGKDVKKLYVDGKTFFGSDPKAATKNLDANVISKVQVFNEKSEQSKLTGVDDGKKEKAMNLELKEEFKKGAFGKIAVAGGNEDRWATRGNYNRFNKKEQFSVIGFGNNVNETGVNWDDYSEFKGQNTWNNDDSGDFGFRGGGNVRYYYMGGNAAYMNNFDGRGFTKNKGIGTNYNFDNKKTKVSSSYFYNQTDLDLKQFAERQSFLQNNSFFNSDTLNSNNFKSNHSFATRIEKELDSMNLFIFKTDFRFTSSVLDENTHQLFTKSANERNNDLNIQKNSDSKNAVSNSLAIFRHKFKKKGRSFSISTAYNHNAISGNDVLLSVNQFFKANTVSEQIRFLNRNSNDTKSKQGKTSLLFTDALSKKFFLETFYNFALTDNQISRPVTNPENNENRIDSLSIYYKNGVLYNRFGSTFRYAHEGVNISTGLAAQQIQLSGKYARSQTENWLETPIKRDYFNIVPYFQTDIEFKNDISANFSYAYAVNEPKIEDLQPIPNVNNPAFRIEGNPNLTPERNHNFNGGLNYWNAGNAIHAGIDAEYAKYDNRIVYSQQIENIEKVGLRTTTRPINVATGSKAELNTWGGFPIVKSKLTVNFYGGIEQNIEPAFVNDVQNETDSRTLRWNTGLNFTPNPKLIMSLSGNINRTKMDYSISPEQNQVILSQTLNASMKWAVLKKTFLESNYAFSAYQNKRFDFEQNIPIWNASVRQLIGKSNKFELRLAVFDILNKRVNVSQRATQNFVQRSIAPTLARYAVLSVAYNIRGYETKLKKNNWF